MATTSQDPLVNALCELGFTEIEALVYAFLAGGGAQTALGGGCDEGFNLGQTVHAIQYF